MSAALRAISLVCALAVAGGCSSDPTRGYSFSTAYDENVQTISAPIFDNITFHHGLEAYLSEAIVKEIHRSTPWAVTGEQGAETTLTGTITEVRLQRLSTDNDSGFVSEVAVDMAVDFTWRDNRTGETILSRRNFRAVGSFAPGPGAREPIELGEQAAIERLAKSIVGELRSDW